MNPIRWTERQCLWYLFPLIISISFAMDVFVPAIPMMTLFFHTNYTIMQASLYIFMLTVAIGQLIIGPLADKFGRRNITFFVAVLFFIGSILSSMAISITTLLFARMIQAAGACGTYLLCFIIVRDNFSTTVCARLFSFLTGANSMIASSAPVIGGLLLDLTQDWHSGFYFLTMLGLIMSLIAYRTIPNYPYLKRDLSVFNVLKTYLQIISNYNFKHYALIASAALLGLYLFCALSSGILISTLKLSPTSYGLWFGLNAMIVFIANSIAARLTYSYPLKTIVLCGLCIMIGACLLMLGLNIYQISIVRFMVPMLCLTLGIGLTHL